MKDNGFVSVGCKIPSGLHLDLKTNDGPQRVTLVGANASRIVGGYGITENVPAEFFNEWMRRNAKHAAVVNGLIFAHSETKSAESMARERATNVTGLEPVDPLKNGMLKGENGEVDKAALAAYNDQRAKNPERNRQRVE